jgi:hypothetical protein
MAEKRICPRCQREFSVPSAKTRKIYCTDACNKYAMQLRQKARKAA